MRNLLRQNSFWLRRPDLNQPPLTTAAEKQFTSADLLSNGKVASTRRAHVLLSAHKKAHKTLNLG